MLSKDVNDDGIVNFIIFQARCVTVSVGCLELSDVIILTFKFYKAIEVLNPVPLRVNSFVSPLSIHQELILIISGRIIYLASISFDKLNPELVMLHLIVTSITLLALSLDYTIPNYQLVGDRQLILLLPYTMLVILQSTLC